MNDPSGGALPIEVPITGLTGYKGELLPIRFSLYNEANEVQYSQDLNVPVLDFTKEELREVIDQIPADAKPNVKKAVEEKLKPALTATATTTPSPATPTSNATAPQAPAPVVPTPLKTRPESPSPTRPVTPAESPRTSTVTTTTTPAVASPQRDGSSNPSNVASIVVGLIMTLTGLGIAAWGWVNANGMPQLPF